MPKETRIPHHFLPDLGIPATNGCSASSEADPDEAGVCIRFDPYLREHDAQLDEDGAVRFAATSTSTGLPVYYSTPPANPESEFRRQHALTLQAIDEYAAFMVEARGNKAITANNKRGYLMRLFGDPLVWDEALGRRRALTLPEVMRPGYGPRVVTQMRRQLAEDGFPESVIGDLLRALRTFGRYLERHYVLDNGVNLVDRYGPLVCPVADRDVRPRPRKRPHGLPTDEGVRRICDYVISQWAPMQRQKGPAHRNGTMFVTALGCGARGKELRDAPHHQPFLESDGMLLLNRSKSGHERAALVDPDQRAVLLWWLVEGRRKLLGSRYAAATDDPAALLFPASRGDLLTPMSAGTFSEQMRSLTADLARRGLVLPAFSFHDCRKSYTSNYLDRGGDPLWLLKQCDWADTSQFASYYHARPQIRDLHAQEWRASVEAQRRAA